MNWQQRDRYWQESDSGYRISAARVREAALRYCAWAPLATAAVEPGMPARPLIGCYPDAEVAKAACDEHARKAA